MWALQFTCIKLTQDQMGPFFTVWGPMLIATLLLAPFALRDFKSDNRKFKDILIFGQLALLGSFPSQVLITWGTQKSLASNAAILTLCLPVITAVFAFLILRERMNIVRWVSFIIAIAGVLMMSTGDLRQMDFGSKYAFGNLLIFLAVTANSYYNVGIKKIASRYSEVEMIFFTYCVIIILLTPLLVYYEHDVFARIPRFTHQTWTGVILLTLFHNFLSMVLFFRALKILDATQVALSNYLIAFFGLPVAALWLKETLNVPAIVGGVMVFASTLIITIVDYRMQHKNKFRKLYNQT